MSRVAPFPLAHSRRAASLVNQVLACKFEKRRARLDALLVAEGDKLHGYGVEPEEAARQIAALRDRVEFLIACRPILETSA